MASSRQLRANSLDPVILRVMINQRYILNLLSPVSPSPPRGDEFIQLKPGTVVEARCIYYNKIVNWIGNTNVTYSIDGRYQNTTGHSPTGAPDYLYNQSLFRVSGLDNMEHTLRVDLVKPSMLLVRKHGFLPSVQTNNQHSARLSGLR
jgi:hypothetical protein